MKKKSDNTPKSAVAYLRVSTSEQSESGLGLKHQRDSIKRFAKQQGLRIRKYYTDAGISGAKGINQRPALSEMLSDLKPNTVVIVQKIDRLSRDTFLNLWIEKECGKVSCQILSASGEGNGDSATDKLLRGIISNFAQFEREMISQRTKDAMSKLTRKVGRPPFGFTYDTVGRLVKNKEEHQHLERMIELRKEFGNKWTTICNTMNAENRPTQKGKDWYPTSVMNCVLRIEKEKIMD
jgi:site-specific DNA recombinase